MDQYPYSIPPSYPYPDSTPDKSSNIADESGVQGPNPYFINSGSAEFGFVPPPLQQQQQQILPPPAPQANGLMPQLHPAVPAGYDPYENHHYPGQVPPVHQMVALETPLPPEPAVVCTSEIFNPQEYEREATSTNVPTPMEYHRPVVDPDMVPPSLPISPAVPLGTDVEAVHSFGGATQDIAPMETAPVAMACALETNIEITEQQITVISSNSSELNQPSEPVLETESSTIVSSEVHASTESSQPTPATDVDTAQPLDKEVDATTATVEGTGSDLPATEAGCVASDAEPVTQSTQEPVETILEIPSVEPSTSPTSRLDKSAEETGSLSTKKKRRRIVQFNDDDDSEEEDCRKRMELLRSPEPPAVEEDPVTGNVPEPLEGDAKQDDNVGGDDGGSGKEDDERPDSRASGSDAASIFHNVVMIPAGESEAHKRKKIRVLESDDDEEEQRVVDNVDDIGLTGDGHGDELNPGRFLMDENAEDGDYGAMEGIEMDKMEQIVTMDAPIFDPNNMMNEEEDEAVSESGEKDKDASDPDQIERGSDREQEERASDAEEEPEDELGEEEEIIEEGVEMITAENEEGEAIGLATDDENELVDEPQREESEEEDRGSDQEEQASEAARSDAEVSEEEQASESEKEDGDNQNENDQSDCRSTPSPVEHEKESQDSDQGKEASGSKSGSEDDVVCQNDLELNTISLLTDEEDDNPTPLPPPKKELPVVRIVNIKKEVLDDRSARRDVHGRMDTAASYQQQHYIRQQQQLAQRKQEKKKKKQRAFDNNDPFAAAESSSDDEFIPNDIYFGTPDRVFTANTKIRCQRQKIMNERFNSKYGRPGSRPGRRRYSDDSDVEERRKRKQKMDQVARLNLPSYQQQQLNNLIKKKKKRKPDRFYDKSQDIPNDIYFGNVDVPLHILYAFGSSSSDDERPGRNRPSVSWKTPPSSSAHKYSKYQSSSKPSKSGASSTHSRSALSPSNDKSVQAMKEYLKIAGFKNVKFHKLWEGCKSNQERANAILRLMQEKGLEGDPTIAKCRELRKQLQMEREARVLDTSLIIDSGEGRITRRSARNPQHHGLGDPSDPGAPSTSGQAPFIPPESLETLNRIKNVIDPDSDGD